MLKKQAKQLTRKRRVRAGIAGSLRPRLCVFRSNKHIYAQIIDDANGKTLVSMNDFSFAKNKKTDSKSAKSNTKEETPKKEYFKAFEIGKSVAKAALGKKITEVVFDRSGYKYHGNIKAIADGAREGGLKF